MELKLGTLDYTLYGDPDFELYLMELKQITEINGGLN